ncbi:hypothetical protein GGR58DRAFT_474589 [Xylaria digitata]|nr:hypothetical protein GGR58DRAFT_474589 [Xylaria digitata]
MADEAMDATAMNLWIVSGQGSFHLPFPAWDVANPDDELGQIVKNTIDLLDTEAETFGEGTVRVRIAEGTQAQRIWTATTLAHREMYYAGVRDACEDYANYQIALRLWIQRDLVCYTFAIPRVYKDFPYPKPDVTGDNIDASYADTCSRINAPAPEEVEPDKATMMVNDLRSYVEGAFCHLNASLQLIQRRVEISNDQIQALQDDAKNQVKLQDFARNQAIQSYNLSTYLSEENALLRQMVRNQGGFPEDEHQD